MKMLYKIIGIILVAYILVASGRFWFYLARTWKLIDQVPAQDYMITGGTQVLRVAVLGDSASVGTGASHYTKTYHYQFLERHKDTYSFDVENKGVVGARVADLADQIEEMRPSDIAIISIGGNNVTHVTPWAIFERDLATALDAASQKAGRIILLTPGDVGDVRNMPYIVRWAWSWRSLQLGGYVARVVQDMPNVTHINMYELDEGHFHEQPEVYYARDLFHPSDAGYKLWADALDTKVNFE